MRNERDDDSEEFVEVTELHELWAYVFFTMGAASQAAFCPPKDEDHRRRNQKAAVQLGRLMDPIAAALKVAMAHPDEFWQRCERPIRLERVKW